MSGRLRFIVLAILGAAQAQAEQPTQPILRIDTGRHSAFIHALALDESRGRLYSASEDKTVRVWRISDGRLLETFRVPIGERADGQLYALALSPDHRTLAVGGWTCWDAEGKACVYLLDAESGALLARIRGIPEVVAALRFSPDGSEVAVGLMGRGGLQIYRVADRTLIASDAAYRDKLLELDFTPDGRLVTSSLDGFLRLYDRQFALIGRVNSGLAGHQPFGLRCSPDGRFVAIGFNDVAHVSVLAAKDLKPIRTLNVVGPAPGNLTRVGWSPDSSALYATGEPHQDQAATVFRWRVAGSAQADRAFATEGRIGDLAVTHDQFVAFASDEPSLGLLDASGNIRYRLLSGVPDYSGADMQLRVSRDGSEVEVPLARHSGERRRFAVLRGILTRAQTPSADLLPPTTSAPGWRVTHWGSDAGPRVNGKPIRFDPYDQPHTFSIASDAGTLLIGTEWSLRAIDAKGEAKWNVRTPTAVRAVNSSKDGRYAIAALADGTINWYSLADGTPILSLFLDADGESWVVWTPSGYYASSVYGDNLVGWQINQGPDRSPDFFHAVQFERELYRPDVVVSRLAGTPAPPGGELQGARHLLEVAPPRVTLSSVDPGAPGHAARLRIIGESSGLPMHDVAVYVNDIPITRSGERALKPAEASHFAREVEIPLDQSENEVRVEVFNGRSLGVSEKLLTAAHAARPAQPPDRGDLYVLSVGANVFPALGHDLYLSYAARDAQEFARALSGSTQQFRAVHVHTLSDGGTTPSRANVLAMLEQLKQASGRDTVIVFLASHGVSDSVGNYYFVPRDVKKADVDAILDGRLLPAESSLIGWQTFFDALRNTAGRRLLIVDTCQARNISGRVQEFSLIKRSAASHIGFIVASKGDEESQEYPAARHGLFTYALLEGLGGAADADHDGRITVAEWFNFAAISVERLRDRRIGPQTPQFMAPRALQIVEIPRVTRVEP